MISADRFLELLEEKDLLPSGVLAKLRQQVARAPRAPKASGVAKALIDKGYLTPVLAKRLLESEPDEEVVEVAEEVAEDAPPARSAEFVASAASPTLLDDELVPLEAVGDPLAAPARAPLDNLYSGPAMEIGSPTEGGTLASGKKGGLFGFLKRGPKSGKKKEDWGSVFMLVGGGGLLVLIFAGVGLTWWLYRLGLEQKYEEAEKFYKATSYEQAKHTYQEFAQAFPNRPEASTARVLAGLCDMRQFEQGEDWVGGLDCANKVLEPISHEEGFGEKSDELSGMLMKFSEGLAARAKEKSSPELVAKTREALGLIEKYVPRSLQQPQKLADVEASLGLTVRQIDRDKELDKAVASLQDAIKQQKTADAYTIRRVLLKKYPDLQDNAKLAATMAAISQAQFSAVKAVAETKAATKEELPTPIFATVALAQRNTKTPLDDLQGRAVCIAAGGAAYGIDASSGKLLWRRFLGYPKSVQHIASPPIPVSAESGADVLAVDSAQNEILRLESLTGRLQWRYSAGEPFVLQPVLAENRVLVSAPSGKVIAIDAESGDSTGYAQLPQPVSVAPAVDLSRKLVYQVAEHSNLYVLGLDDFTCKSVFLLGHDAGSITSAPAVVGGNLVLGVNDGAQDSSLRLFAIERGSGDKPGITVTQVQKISLSGRIDITPAVDGNRVLVATDRGVVKVFDLTPTEKGNQLKEIAGRSIEGSENVVRYALLQGGQFFIADIQLSKFDVVGSKGQLVPKWIVDEGCGFLQAPIAAGPVVITARRKSNLPGVLVSATGIEDQTRSWETIVGAPPAGDLVLNDQTKRLVAVTAMGGLFELDAANLKNQPVLDAPVVSIETADLQAPIGAITALDKGAIAVAAAQGASRVNVFDPSDTPPRYRWLGLGDKSACPPINVAGGIAVPTQGGAIFLLDPQSGKPLAAPFQARLDNGVKPAWQKPAACGKQEFVIADGKATLYHMGVADKPKPHLAALEQVEAASEPGVPVAVLGSTAFVAGPSQTLGVFEVQKLKRLNEHKLSGRPAWGPAAIGSYVLLATDDDQLLCLDGKGEKLWQTALAYGPLAGTPLLVEDGFMLASVSGAIARVDAKAGKELGKVEIGRALASGPVATGGNVFVVGTDGSIYEVKQP
jgi:outer membrane protein assembly factor BamB